MKQLFLLLILTFSISTFSHAITVTVYGKGGVQTDGSTTKICPNE